MQDCCSSSDNLPCWSVLEHGNKYGAGVCALTSLPQYFCRAPASIVSGGHVKHLFPWGKTAGLSSHTDLKLFSGAEASFRPVSVMLCTHRLSTPVLQEGPACFSHLTQRRARELHVFVTAPSVKQYCVCFRCVCHSTSSFCPFKNNLTLHEAKPQWLLLWYYAVWSRFETNTFRAMQHNLSKLLHAVEIFQMVQSFFYIYL